MAPFALRKYLKFRHFFLSGFRVFEFWLCQTVWNAWHSGSQTGTLRLTMHILSSTKSKPTADETNCDPDLRRRMRARRVRA